MQEVENRTFEKCVQDPGKSALIFPEEISERVVRRAVLMKSSTNTNQISSLYHVGSSDISNLSFSPVSHTTASEALMKPVSKHSDDT